MLILSDNNFWCILFMNLALNNYFFVFYLHLYWQLRNGLFLNCIFNLLFMNNIRLRYFLFSFLINISLDNGPNIQWNLLFFINILWLILSYLILDNCILNFLYYLLLSCVSFNFLFSIFLLLVNNLFLHIFELTSFIYFIIFINFNILLIFFQLENILVNLHNLYLILSPFLKVLIFRQQN